MTLIDIILLVLLAGFIVSGFHAGLVHAIGSIVGVLVGAYVATHYSNEIALWVAAHTHVDIRAFGTWITFLLIFFVFARLFGVLFWFVEKTIGILVHLPVIASINSIGGGVLGFVEGVLVIGLSLYYAKYLPVPEVAAAIKASQLAPQFVKTSQVLMPFIPESVRNVMYGKF